ncbi:unnamed protein product [Rangifer tarandus platyrhynchus]|uniref:Uncharacterized protein n=2 Tax=Rangifer tarandus platyrhynchus TaxID=3082113 RepID=A0ABN8ZX29_RANTA|nr:unnamed protein product [Rangifer tarandus platyrhynchus]CAI9711521.1 unnamed protein product [Rangifer tarandus platyrhynchus]
MTSRYQPAGAAACTKPSRWEAEKEKLRDKALKEQAGDEAGTRVASGKAGVELCGVVARVVSPLLPGKLPQCPSICELPGASPGLARIPAPFPDRVLSRFPSASEAAGCRVEAQRPVEEKPRRKGGEGE